jgi:hypothetical protein
MRTTMRYGLLSLTVLLSTVISTEAAQAQGFQGQIKQNKMDKVHFYNSPRQMQILDERPIIKDFREAPASSPMISLPPGPQAGGGGYGGNGAGALGDNPSGGGGGAPVQLGGPGVQPYRTADNGGQLPLPKSGFNGPTNIPARGLGPRGALADATTTNRLMGQMLKPKEQIGGTYPAGSLGGGPRRSVGKPAAAAPVAASYGSNYGAGTGTGTSSGGSGRTEGVVRGTLLKKTN